jgi:hypothetical protein
MNRLTVRELTKVNGRGHLLAFLTIETPSGLIIRDCRLFEKDGKRWIGLPSRQYTKADGSTAYAQIIDLASKQLYSRFQEDAIQAVDAFLEGGADGTY